MYDGRTIGTLLEATFFLNRRASQRKPTIFSKLIRNPLWTVDDFFVPVHFCIAYAVDFIR